MIESIYNIFCSITGAIICIVILGYSVKSFINQKGGTKFCIAMLTMLVSIVNYSHMDTFSASASSLAFIPTIMFFIEMIIEDNKE